ncbi:MarR family transcriptional regulator, partial [Patescibacteria group bacterium]|nr:MarR family transcriptional regulator [Patescibacteria group bacterium]
MSSYLTPKQERVLGYLEEEIRQKGRSPSLRQAAADLGISHAAVSQFIQALESKGYLKKRGRYGRKLELLQKVRMPIPDGNWRQVPIIGKINAGLPLYAQQDW